jgi:heme/copper-type cytochrome/quinol oxidase subunit 4
MRALITAGIRIIVIFSFIQALIILVNNIYLFLTGSYESTVSRTNDLGIMLIVFFLILLVLWVVWWKAGPIAGFLGGNIEENQLTINTY